MKICMITGPFFPVPPNEGGAMEKFSWQMACEFAQAGHDVFLLSVARNTLAATETLRGVQIFRTTGAEQKKQKMIMLMQAARYAMYWIRNAPDADVFLVQDVFFPLFAQFTKKRKKTIYLLGRTAKPHVYLYPRVQYFITPSRASSQILENFLSFRAAKVHTIGFATNQSLYCQQSQTLTSKEQIKSDEAVGCCDVPVNKPERPLRFLYVGRIHPEKGLELLVDAFNEFASDSVTVELHIIGPDDTAFGGGGPAFLKRLKERSKAAITFLPAIFNELELSSKYQSADFFCYPSLAESGETFGLAVLEAMSCGCVPIVSDLHCFKDFVVHQKTGFVFNHRKKDRISDLIDCLHSARTSANAQEMRTNALQCAAHYSTEKVAHRYLSLFESLGGACAS